MASPSQACPALPLSQAVPGLRQCSRVGGRLGVLYLCVIALHLVLGGDLISQLAHHQHLLALLCLQQQSRFGQLMPSPRRYS